MGALECHPVSLALLPPAQLSSAELDALSKYSASNVCGGDGCLQSGHTECLSHHGMTQSQQNTWPQGVRAGCETLSAQSGQFNTSSLPCFEDAAGACSAFLAAVLHEGTSASKRRPSSFSFSCCCCSCCRCRCHSRTLPKTLSARGLYQQTVSFLQGIFDCRSIVECHERDQYKYCIR